MKPIKGKFPKKQKTYKEKTKDYKTKELDYHNWGINWGCNRRTKVHSQR